MDSSDVSQWADGGETNRGTAAYLVTDGPAGRRISVRAVHRAPDVGRSR